MIGQAWSAVSVIWAVLVCFAVLAALLVVSLRNIVHAAFALVAALVALGASYLALGADFLGLAQVLVYGGAVAVVLVFAIALTRVDDKAAVVHTPQRPFAAFLASGLAVMMLVIIGRTDFGAASRGGPAMDMDAFTAAAFGKYMVPFEAVSLVLLAAMVGAIYLVRKGGDEE